MSIGSIYTAKESAETYQPLYLVQVTLVDGTVLRYSTHPLHSTYGAVASYAYGGYNWEPRILEADIGPLQASDVSLIVVPQVSFVLADPDKAVFLQESTIGFKGAEMRILAIMHDAGDITTGSFSSNAPIKFIGLCSAATNFDESTITITADSKLNMSQTQMPPLRIQPRCPWTFPRTKANRISACSDPSSIFYECGYSPDITDGDVSGGTAAARGNYQSGTACFTSCSRAFEDCVARMGDSVALVPINQDGSARDTGVFGGMRWIPDQKGGNQRQYVTGKWDEIVNARNEAKNGDSVPLAYGTTWLEPKIMGVWGDGNYTNYEVLLTYGKIDRIRKVVVNGQEVSRLRDDTVSGGYRDSTRSIDADAMVDSFKNGYWKTVNNGQRHGLASGEVGWGKQGDPYGSYSAIYISVLRDVAKADSLPRIQVLVDAQHLRIYTDTSNFSTAFTRNPAWVLLDLLSWSSWKYADIDIQSFIDAAATCGTQINFNRMDGQYTNTWPESGVPIYFRYTVGFALSTRRSFNEVVRGVLNAMNALLFFDYSTGKLKIVIKETLGEQQPDPITGSNDDAAYASYLADGSATTGHVAYSFDETNIRKDDSGRSTLRFYQKTNRESPNKLTIQFQNRENQYSLDSLTIVETEDTSRIDDETAGSYALEGLQSFDHVRRCTARFFAESFRGNPRTDWTGIQTGDIGDTGGTWWCDLQTTVKAVHLMVGQLVHLSDSQHNLDQQLMRVMKIQASMNGELYTVSLMFHNDNWYLDTFGQDVEQHFTRPRRLVDRPPYAWRPGYETPATGDVYYGQTDLGFGLAVFYETAADGTVIAKTRFAGRPPVNKFPDVPGRPLLELTGQGTTGGGYPSTKSYWAGLCAKTDATTAYLLSPMSEPVMVDLDGSETALSFFIKHWPDNPSGYVAFAGLDPFAMSYQTETTTIPTGAVSLTNTYNEASWGPPDEAFERFVWQVRRIVHSGILGAEITAFDNTTVHLSMFENHGFTVNELAGYELAIFGIKPVDRTTPTYVPIANFTIASNGTASITISGGNLTACVNGSSIKAEDVVVVRMKPTFGSDTTGNYFEDAQLVNPLNLVDDPYTVVGATNASPIVVTISASTFPYSNGDVVVVQGVVGNEAANGAWTIANVDDINMTFELSGSTGSGNYDSGGLAYYQYQGMIENDEVGNIAFIIAGTGRGTFASIKENTATRFYINGDWPISPDATSRIIILEPTIQIEQATQRIVNADPAQVDYYDVDVRNYLNQSLFVQAVTESYLGHQAPKPYSPFREFWLYGDAGANVAGFNGAILLSVDGVLAIGSDLAPHIFVNKLCRATAIKAQVKVAPTGDDAVVQIKVGGAAYITLTIPDGSTSVDATAAEISAAPDISPDLAITLDITGIGNTDPGADLSVEIFF